MHSLTVSSGCSLIGHSLPIFLVIAKDEHNCYLPPLMNVLQCWNRILHICLLAHVHSCTCVLCHMVSAQKHWTPHTDYDLLLFDQGNLPRAAQHLSTAELTEKSKICRLHVSYFPEATRLNTGAHQQILTKRTDTMKLSGTENKRQIGPVIPVLCPLKIVCADEFA